MQQTTNKPGNQKASLQLLRRSPSDKKKSEAKFSINTFHSILKLNHYETFYIFTFLR
jgi:hypothetical protein